MAANRALLQSIREDDFVEYFLFPAGSTDPQDVQLENSDASLEVLLQDVNRIAEEFCQQYIWHRDAFHVVPRPNNDSRLLIEVANGTEGSPVDGSSSTGAQLPAHLHGISHVGDNIQDEWFIVALLFHLTEQLPGLAVRVIDADGEFLLIEAAEQLPRWATPETCEGRVFIVNGTLRLLEGKGDDESNRTTVPDVGAALELVRGRDGTKYTVSDEVTRCIRDRIVDFPAKITDHHHRATVYVPVGVAAVLRENPQLVAPAVLAFRNRDPIDLKVCRAMRFFPPECCVYASVTFTKCLYAMLSQSRYQPDRRTGWTIPPATDPNHKAHLLGLKLACGFEILASQAKAARTDWESDKGWQSYRQSLTAKGYFRENIEGSQEHTKLLAIARDYYAEHRESMRSTPKIGEEIVSILRRNEWDVEDLRKQGEALPAADSDDWMNISPEELDRMLTERYGAKKLFSLNCNGNTQQAATDVSETFTSMVSEFLDRKSEYDGIVVEPEETRTGPTVDPALLQGVKPSPTKPKRTRSKAARDRKADTGAPSPGTASATVDDLSPSHQPSSNSVDFDAGAFGMHVKNMLDLLIPEDRWDSSEESEMSDYSQEGQDEYERNLEDMSPTRVNRAIQGELKSYMDQMDRELAGTTIGRSFETAIGHGEGEESVEQSSAQPAGDDFDDIETFKPVNIDVNTLRNMMESYQSQLGGPGPAANLLGSMGVQIAKGGGGGGSTKQTDV
ncbi:protein ecdysoneless [Anopheles aquasalis]|uniref:protein ecdysoneless n=1 Tax=Anopheles aquasalis TaxID=42839 RepID=UPI00215B51A9|nr:protein ecdysoneless [Anopheles aquasalis]